MEQLQEANAEVVGVYYADAFGTPMTPEETDAKMESLGWAGEGYRISDEEHDLWMAKATLWPGAPGVFIVRTADMKVVAAENTGMPLDLVQWAQTIND
jgi:hypothetical protein